MSKAAHGIRVLALGDSFTWATGVTYDEGVVTVLERTLRDRLPQVEILNLGVPGFEPEHELDLYRQFGVHLQPDAVVLNLFVGNDIMRKRGVGREAAIIIAGNIFYVHQSGNWVHDHWGPDRWYLYHDLNYLLKVDLSPLRRWFRRQRPPGIVVASAQASESRQSALPSGWSLDYLSYLEERSDIFTRKDTDEWNFHWEFTQATLDSLVDALRAQHIPLVIAIIPEQVQLDQELQRSFLTVIGASTGSYDFRKPQKMLSVWCRQREVSCVDLLARWNDGSSRDTLYLPNDTHWTREGHARAAAEIFPVLLAELAPLKAKRDQEPSVKRTELADLP